MINFIALVIAVVLMLYFFSNSLATIKGAPFIPSSRKHIAGVLSSLPISSKTVFYELGSGDGWISIHTAKTYGCKCVGVELNYLLYWWSLLKARLTRLSNIRFIHRNVLKIDFSNADIVFIFLLPPIMQKLVPKLKNLKTGSIVISHGFPIKELTEKQTAFFQGKGYSTFIYTI